MRHLFIALLVLAPLPALADPPAITVTGTGDVAAAPDQAEISAGVVSDAPTAAGAVSANAAAMSRVMAALRTLGIPAAMVRTDNYSLQPRYADGNSNARHAVAGYTVSNDVRVTLDDPARAGAVLDVLVGAGANQAGGISFTLKDDAAALAKARENAVADAVTRARIYAKAAGVTLGPIRAIREGGEASGNPRPMFMMAKAATPVSAGLETVSASVTMVWDIQ